MTFFHILRAVQLSTLALVGIIFPAVADGGVFLVNVDLTTTRRLMPSCDFDSIRIVIANGKDVSVWDTESGGLQRVLAPHAEEVRAVAISPVNDLIITGGGDSFETQLYESSDTSIRVWDAEDGNLIRKFGGDSTYYIESLQFSADGSLVLSASNDATASVWEVGSGERKHLLPQVYASAMARFDAGGKAITCASHKSVSIYEQKDGEIICTGRQSEGGGYRFADLSADGTLLATASYGGVIRVTTSQTADKIAEFQHGRYPAFVVFLSDSTIISGSDDCSVRIWDTEDRAGKHEVRVPGPVRGFAVSPDNTRCVVTWSSPDSHNIVSISGASLLDLREGKVLRNFEEEGTRVVGFSPDGASVLVLQGHRPAFMVDALTGELAHAYPQ